MKPSTETSIDPRVQVVSVGLDGETRTLVDRLAADEERSRSQIVRRAIRVYADSRSN